MTVNTLYSLCKLSGVCFLLAFCTIGAYASTCSEAGSPLASLIKVGNDDLSKTPLILIHGTHGTASDEIVTKLSREQNKTEYWGAFIDQYWNNTANGLQKKYQLFIFRYCSDRRSVKDIAGVLGSEIDAKLSGRQHVVLAHSMGGLVAKSYMVDYEHKSGNWVKKKGGDTVIGLITLATPHHGTPGANDPKTWQMFVPDYLTDLFPLIVQLYWENAVGKNHPSSSNSAIENRSDLRWDNYDRKLNSKLKDLNFALVGNNSAFKPYAGKLIAYAGALDTSFRPVDTAALIIEIKETGNKAINKHRLLTLANVGIIYGLGKTFSAADGLVPLDSGLFCNNKEILTTPNGVPPNFVCFLESRVRRFEAGGKSDLGSEVGSSEYPDANTKSIFRTRRGFDHLDMLEHAAVLRYVVEDLSKMPLPVPLSPPTASAPNIPTLFLFDVSGSMSDNDKIGQARTAGLDALKEMREAGSPPTSIMTFSGDQCDGNVTKKLLGYTTDIMAAERIMRTGLPPPNGGTPIPQARDAAISDLSVYLNINPNLKEGRVILLSDGQSTCGAIRPPGVFSQRTNISVKKDPFSRIRFFTIGFDIPAGSAAERDLQFLASETGGKYYNAAERDQLIRTLRKQVRRYIPRQCNSGNADFANGVRAFAAYDYTAATDAFRRYTSANQNDWCGFYNLGLAYEASDHYKKAAENYQKYLATAPTSPDRTKIEAKIAEMNEEYVVQFDYYTRLITSDLGYLNAFYKTVFNRSSGDLAAEFDGFVYEKRAFYANLSDTLEIDQRWLSNDSKDISSSLEILAKRRNLESFDRDAVSLLTTPIGQIEDMLDRLRDYRIKNMR